MNKKTQQKAGSKERNNKFMYKTNIKAERQVLSCLGGFLYSYYDRLNQLVMKRESGGFERLRIKVLLVIGKFKRVVVLGLLGIVIKLNSKSVEISKNLKRWDYRI